MRLPPRCVEVRGINKKQSSRGANTMSPQHINPVQWHQAADYARQACARIFRDGGTPAEALSAFGLQPADASAGWSVAVDRIAQALCAPLPALRRAA
jgi:hypothetical protein